MPMGRDGQREGWAKGGFQALKTVEFIHQALGYEGDGEGSAAFHQHPADTPGGELVEQVPKATAASLWGQAQVLHSTKRDRISCNSTKNRLARDGSPDPGRSGHLPVLIHDHARKTAVRGRRGRPAIRQLRVVHLDGVATHDNGFGGSSEGVSQLLHPRGGHLGALAAGAK